MTVVERTEGGYTKVETKNGAIQYRDSNGHPVKQQSFAASKQQEQYDVEITERDEETGEIQDSETGEVDEDVRVGPPAVDAARITASFNAETDDTMGSNQFDKVEVDAEMGGVFTEQDAPTNDEIKDKMKELRMVVSAQMPFVGDADINIERTPVRTQLPARGWGSFAGRDAVDIEFDSGYEKSYEIDPVQTKIENW